MKPGATIIFLSGMVLMSCGPQPAPTVTPRPKPPQANNPASAREKEPRIPGFHLPSEGSSASMMPSGGVLLAHWDDIQKQILARPAGEQRDRFMAQSIRQLATEDPERAARVLTDWKNAIPSRWAETAKTVLQELWKKDAPAAVDFLSSQVPPALQGGLWQRVLAELPPAEGAVWIDRITHAGGKFRAAASLLARWPRQDPEAAAAWMDQFAATLTPEQLEVMASPNYLYFNMTDRNGLPPIEAARRAFAAAKAPAARRFFADNYLRSVKQHEPAQLAEITSAVEAELFVAGTKGFREEIALNQMREDPARYVAELTPEEVKRLPDSFLGETIRAWADKDSPAATRWALSLNREQEVVSGVHSWYSLDPSAATSFAFSLPSGKMRDDSLAALCGRLGWDQDFSAAETCLKAIVDEKIVRMAVSNLERARQRYSKKD